MSSVHIDPQNHAVRKGPGLHRSFLKIAAPGSNPASVATQERNPDLSMFG